MNFMYISQFIIYLHFTFKTYHMNLMKLFVLLLTTLLFSIHTAQSQSDTLTDNRDGQTYPVVQIGDQIWMAQNLNFKTEKSYCYANKSENCEKYGRLYSWEIANEVCPNGWHLATDKEWMDLEAELGMNPADTAKGDVWRGTDQGIQLAEGGTSGFNAKFGGYRNPPSNYFLENMHTFFWTATVSKGGYRVWYRQLIKGDGKIMRHNQPKSWGMYVRCVKD